MGWVMMRERELRRVEVLAELEDGSIDAASAPSLWPLRAISAEAANASDA
jgi:hypothetical protein